MGSPLRYSRFVLGAIMVVLAGCSASCASPSVATAGDRPSVAALPTFASGPLGGCASGSAYGSSVQFALSIAVGVTGAPTPEQAAVEFVKHGGIPGFESKSTGWVSQPDQQGFILRNRGAFLHVIYLSSGGWVVDSGGGCG